MAIDPTVFRAILAMDSYNRGGDGLKLPSSGSSIGTAIISTSRKDGEFFAQSYDWNGTKVISYRGTDNIAADAATGWITGGGIVGIPGSQATKAADFYKTVLGSTNPYNGNVEFTGHSLGGGLAGFIASLYGKKAVVFDNMPYELAALNAYASSMNDLMSSDDVLYQLLPDILFNGYIRDKYYFNGALPVAPNWANPAAQNYSDIDAYAITGEVLSNIRLIQGNPVTYIDSTDKSLSASKLHSQALLVMLLHAKTEADKGNMVENWKFIKDTSDPDKNAFINALFNADVAKAAGITEDSVPGGEPDAAAMMSMIAYSVVDEGGRPHGDTGIRAMFNDANELGQVLKDPQVSETIKDSTDALSKIFVQFAAQLASGVVFQSNSSIAKDGVLKLSDDKNSLTISFAKGLWSLGRTTAQTDIPGRKEFTDEALAQVESEEHVQDIRTGMKWLWNDDDSKIIDTVVMRTNNLPFFGTLPNRTTDFSNVSIFAAGGNQDSVTGSAYNDFIHGGDANDTIRGANGNDLIAGGDGNDSLSGGAGRDFLAGGKGVDTAYYELTSSEKLNLTLKYSPPVTALLDATIELVRNVSDIDRLIEIERVNLTSNGDILTVPTKVGYLNFDILFDGKSQPAAATTNATQGDMLDFSTNTSPVYIDYARVNILTDALGLTSSGAPFAVEVYEDYSTTLLLGQWLWNLFVPSSYEPSGQGVYNGTGLRFTNFEYVKGSGHDDVLSLWRMSPGGELTTAQRTLLDSARNIGGSSSTPAQIGATFDARMNKAGEIAQNKQQVLIEAGPGDDIVVGSETGINKIYGGTGDDTLVAGGFTSEVFGEEGNDYLEGNGFKSQLTGGAGSDIFSLSNHTFVMDATKEDYVKWGPFRLTGGVEQEWMEGGWAYWTPFTSLLTGVPVISGNIFAALGMLLDVATMSTFRYSVTTGDQLVIQFARGRGGQAVIEKYELDLATAQATGHVVAFKQTFNGTSLLDFKNYIKLALAAGFGAEWTSTDPLVLDMDRDGIELTSLNTKSVYFDLDKDGFAENTAWVRPDDALLARDLNANGKIDDIGELFGNATTSGFAHLKALDSNNDNKITSADAAFASLRVWQDSNTNGITDAGELKTLAAAGITQISLASTATNKWVVGNQIAAEATFTFSNGTTSKIADVRFDNNQTDSVYLGNSTVSTAAAALPNLKGYGTIPNLAIGMTGDATLLTMVTNFKNMANTSTWAQIKDAADNILFRWAKVDTMAATPMGGGTFDQQKLAMLEKYFGYQLTPRDGAGKPLENNLSTLIESWNDVLEKAAIRLALQGPLKTLFPGISYDLAADTFLSASASSLSDAFKMAFGKLSTTAATALTQWNTNWAPLLSELSDNLRRADQIDVKTDYVAQSIVKAVDGTTVAINLQQIITGLGLNGVLIGTDGADTLVRGTGNDLKVYLGGKGNDTYTGGTGQDVYVFGKDFDQDVIHDSEGGDSGDRIRFATYTENDVKFTRSGDDLVITVKNTTHSVTVKDQFITPKVSLGGQQITPDMGVEEIQFMSGKVFEAQDIAAAIGLGTNASEVIDGTGTQDEIEGLKGNDTLKGGDNGDTYYYTRGDGADTIIDIMGNPLLNAPDTLLLFNISLDNIRFSRVGDSKDLTINFAWAGDSITIQDQFYYTPLGYEAKYSLDNRIDVIMFQQGAAMSWLDIQAALINTYTTSGNDGTYGFGTSDYFFASAGNDTIVGFDGGDSYAFGFGSGNDLIHDQSRFPETFISGLVGYSWGSDDTLTFGKGVSADNVTFARIGATDDLLVTINSTGDTLTVKDHFEAYKLDLFNLLGIAWFDRIEEFTFEDGTVTNWKDILKIVTTGTNQSESLYGAMHNDTIDGKEGNDLLSGRDMGDVYLFNLGYGQDRIVEGQTNVLLTEHDTVRFGAGIAVSDMVFTHAMNSDDLLISIRGKSDTLTIVDQYDITETGPFGAVGFNQIERFEWADGTVKTWSTIIHEVIASAKTDGNDTIIGSHFDDTLDGGKGNDRLMGDNGSDTYIFNKGYGKDTIYDHADNILAGSADKVVFGTGILPTDIRFTRSGTDLNDVLLTVGTTADSLLIEDQFDYTTIAVKLNEIETFVFANGTTWTADDLRLKYIQSKQTTGNDTIDGFWTNDTITGGTGNDLLRGGDGSDTYKFAKGFGQDVIDENVLAVTYPDADRIEFAADILSTNTLVGRSGDDLIVTFSNATDKITIKGQFTHGAYFPGWKDIESIAFSNGTVWTDADIRVKLLTQAKTAGNDTITGFWGDDTIDGGAGNDVLRGLGGGDTYLFGKGSGQDIIEESIVTVYEDFPDSINFITGLKKTDVVFSIVGSDLKVAVVGTTDTLTIKNHFASHQQNAMENFRFSDGTVLTKQQVADLIVQGQQTEGADNFTGTNLADTINVLGGNDTVKGMEGNDTIYGGIGNDSIDAGYGNDSIIGGAGNDYLDGGVGDDRFIINQGEGNDTIYGNQNNDIIVFGSGISFTNTTFTRVGTTNDIILTLAGGGSVRVKDAAHIGSFALESFQFSDGTKTIQDIRNKLIANVSTAGNDTIVGFDAADTITGGKGNDSIDGGTGDDRFIINQGDGNDTIYGNQNNDTIVFGTGITFANTTFSRVGLSNDITLTLAGGGSVLVKEAAHWGSFAMENFQFADGTKTIQDIRNKILANASTAGNDTIYGFEVPDSITGGAGHDSIDSGVGNDTIYINQGDGNDTIYGNQGDDKIIFGSGITFTNTTFTRIGEYDLKLTLAGGGSVLVKDAYANAFGLETFQFADVTKNIKDIQALLLVNATTSGNDTIRGFNTTHDLLNGGTGNDVLIDMLGADTLIGGTGADTMTGGLGNGNPDIFVFNKGDMGTGVNADHITDFSQSNLEKINLKGFGFSASSFVGTGAFSTAAATFGYSLLTSGTVKNTVIRIDSDKNGITDAEIILDGSHIALVASDFTFI